MASTTTLCRHERTRFLTEYEIQVLLEKCENQVTSPWLLPLVTLALNTGMRQGELLKLKWENLDLERGDNDHPE